MTDRERQKIEAYLPNPRDPELEFNEYYVLDNRDRPTKVHVVNIGFDKYSQEIWQVFTDKGRLVHGSYETDSEMFGGGWYHPGALYDNKQDCKDCAHSMYDGWEELREIQQKEAKA